MEEFKFRINPISSDGIDRLPNYDKPNLQKPGV